MRAIVLGSAAGGGFPQWNCGCHLCSEARRGNPYAVARTQCGLAVSADGERWVLVNAAPELTTQIGRTPALHAKDGARNSPICAIILTNGEVDAVAGLLSLREGHSFGIHAAPDVLDVLASNPIFEVLPQTRVPRFAVAFNTPLPLSDMQAASLGLSITAFPVPGKIPLFVEGGRDPGRKDDGPSIGLHLRTATSSLFFISGCAEMTDELRERLRGAELVLFDGTLWRDDEMTVAGLGAKTGKRMGHMSISGPGGTLEAFEDLGVRRKVFVHLNNTNPALLACSPEYKELQSRGWEVAVDGMELFQ